MLIRQSRRSRGGESALSTPGSPRTTSLRSLTSPWGRPLPSLSFFSFTLNSARFAHATKHADFFLIRSLPSIHPPTSTAWVPRPRQSSRQGIPSPSRAPSSRQLTAPPPPPRFVETPASSLLANRVFDVELVSGMLSHSRIDLRFEVTGILHGLLPGHR